MNRLIGFMALVAVALFSPVAHAQDAEDNQASAPVLQVTFDETEAVPGQSLSLRLTVLVPTFMPEPPIWPTMEIPNVLVRLPEGSTGPTSDRVGSETWSGVTRHYRISPMVPGSFSIPPQDLVVTWSDPETNEPIKTTVQTGEIAFTGVVPEGAEGLNPFIAAQDLRLQQQVVGDPQSMTPGGTLKRIVTAHVDGVPPMFVPQLIVPQDLTGLASYPDEPSVDETDDRGVPGGTRTESVTYVAESGGGGVILDVSIDWYNTDTGNIETAVAEGFEIKVDGPPAMLVKDRDWRLIALIVVAGLVGLIILLLLGRRLMRPIRRWHDARHANYLASERFAWKELRQVIGERSYVGLFPALDSWADRMDGGRSTRKARGAASDLRVGRWSLWPASTGHSGVAALEAARGGTVRCAVREHRQGCRSGAAAAKSRPLERLGQNRLHPAL
ncbi:BatD family protein [Qingshengfaniella alkalisoli]|uniref:Protein BatD n=1 Tax=Qingshengfaniella alkalisoli TaxID=2599296 RepID=A0A5B8I9H4_9RHOB|nr:BatD family protein [Qingshengfaniella alkalisoli]QDY69616.1 protein BatD [Qingshengfaniella alkalisoli]